MLGLLCCLVLLLLAYLVELHWQPSPDSLVRVMAFFAAFAWHVCLFVAFSGKAA